MLKYLAKFVLLVMCLGMSITFEVKAQCGLSLNFSEGPLTGNSNIECPLDCDGQILLTASGGVTPYTYIWSTTPPQIIQAATGLCAGTYTVTIFDATGCQTIAIDSIVPPPPIAATFTQVQSCFGQNNGQAIVNVGGGCTGGACPYDYVFTNTITGTTQSGSLDSVFNFSPLAPGNYSISVQDEIPCPAVTTSITVTEASQLIPSITDPTGSFITSCPNICDAQGIGTAIGGTPPYTYLWDDPATQTTATASNLCGDPSPGISYILTVTDALGCSETETMPISDPSRITLDFTPTDPTCGSNCDGSGEVTNISGGFPPYTYAWNTGQTNSSVLNALCKGSGSLTVTDSRACDTIVNFTLSQRAPLLGLVVPFSACDGAGNITASASVDLTSGLAPFTYTWDDQAAQVTQTALGLTVGQTYSVVVFDANQCPFLGSTTIETPVCEIIIPNTFSPNDDDFNDIWFIENLPSYTETEVKVYNRWGDIVFTSTGYTEPWDGKYANVSVPAAVYYYVIDVPEIEKNYHGTVTILR